MKNEINWDRKDYWNEYNKYNEYFLSFHFDHVGIYKNKWKELIKKWKLNSKVLSLLDENDDISAYNNDYSIVISGNNCEEVPEYYSILTFSKNLDMKTCIEFYTDFKATMDHYDELVVREGIISEFTSHPIEIIKAMIDKL
jgi:hypothetical protein